MKFLNDIINKLAENNVEVNSQLLVGMRVRTKSDAKLKVISDLAKRVKEKYDLANEFYELSIELAPLILIITNRMLESDFTTSTSEDFEAKLNAHLRIDRLKALVKFLINYFLFV